MVNITPHRIKIINQNLINFMKKHKILRGMLAYSILWPVGSMVQQTIEGKSFSEFDWKRILQFCVYGTLIRSISRYGYLNVVDKMWPGSDIRSSLAKAVTEQFAFDPFSISIFLYTMSIFEGKNHSEAKKEVTTKFLSIYAIGLIYWPIIQTINFTFIKRKNQVIYSSFASLFWTTFLGYVKAQPVDDGKLPKSIKEIYSQRYYQLKEAVENILIKIAKKE